MSRKGLPLSAFIHEKFPIILQNASLQYDAYGLPSNFNDVENGSITTRTINKAIADISSPLAPTDIRSHYHVFHHPGQPHAHIENFDLRPYHIDQQRILTDYCIYFVHSSTFLNHSKPRKKTFTATRVGRLENIIFGNLQPRPNYKYLKQLLIDIGSFHVVLIQRVECLNDVNPSLRYFLPRDDISLKRCANIPHSVPSNWEYFKMISFTNEFFKSGDIESSCCRLGHALGVFDVYRLVGSIGHKKKSSQGNSREYRPDLSKRQRDLNENVKKKIKEMKQRGSHSSYILERVYISRGREGEVLGVIDGGVDRLRDGHPEHIETFSVRFIMQCCDNKKFESITFTMDKIALGLVRARNRKRGGRSNIGLDDDAWTSGTICDRPLSESDL